MPPPTRYARNGDVSIAYETFGDLDTGEPLLLIMGLDFQMVWWPDAFCEQIAASGYAVVRFDNRDTGPSPTSNPPADRARGVRCSLRPSRCTRSRTCSTTPLP